MERRSAMIGRWAILLSVLWLTWTAAAQGSFVVPSHSEHQSGGKSIFGPILPGQGSTYVPWRYQEAFGASDISMPFGVHYITAVSFRLSVVGGGGSSLDAVVPDIEVRLSTTSRTVDLLFPFYAMNTGPDEVVVYPRGSMHVKGEIVPGQSPQPFSVEIPFETPFLYDRSWGNLLLDIVTYANTAVTAGFDAAEIQGDSVSSNMGTSLDRGTPFTIGMVAQFDYQPVPEPATAFLLGLGLLGLIVRWRWRIVAA